MTDDQPPVYDDLFGFLDDDALTIPRPIPSDKYPEGKVYVIPAPSAKVGMRLTALADISRKRQAGVKVSDADVARLNLDDEQEREFAQQVMGTTYGEMVEDGVSWPRIQKVMQYAYIHFAMGPEVAERAAREGLFSGGKVRLPAMNRAARRAASRRQSQTTTPPIQ